MMDKFILTNEPVHGCKSKLKKDHYLNVPYARTERVWGKSEVEDAANQFLRQLGTLDTVSVLNLDEGQMATAEQLSLVYVAVMAVPVILVIAEVVPVLVVAGAITGLLAIPAANNRW